MLFDFNTSNLKYREKFDEFPDIENFNLRFTICPCGSTKHFVVSTVSRHRNFMPIVACSDCGTLRSNPYFTEETAAHYYTNVYGTVKRVALTPKQLFEKQKNASFAPFLSDLIDKFDTVLDYGGGAGGRTAEFLSFGKAVSLHEIEGEYSDYAYSMGIRFHCKENKYDLVVVSHVIEHMIDPVSEMTRLIRDCCSKDGLLLVATPIIDNQPARQWLQHFHISHKYYFNHDAFIGLMAELGCSVVKQNYIDAYVFRVDGKPDRDFINDCYARGAQKTKALVYADSRPTIKRFWRWLKHWQPQPHDQKPR